MRRRRTPSLYDLQAPYLNSMAGTSLDGKGVADTVAILHPFTTFDDNKQYYDDKASTTYYANVWNAVIKNFEEHSIIPAGKVTSDDVVWGGPIWRQMVEYRDKERRPPEEAVGSDPDAGETATRREGEDLLRRLRFPRRLSPRARRLELIERARWPRAPQAMTKAALSQDAPPSSWLIAMKRRVAALDPMRLAGAALFIALWQAATAVVSPIILPGPLSVLQRAVADFWSAPALSYYGVEDPSLFANLLYTAENVAIAVLVGSAIGVTLGLLSARIWFVRAAIDPIMMTAGRSRS